MLTIFNKKILIIPVLCFLFTGSNATIIGADIGWTCLGGDSFLIKVSAYADCNGSAIGNITVNFKCATSGSSITSLNLTASSPVDITPVCNTSCSRCQSSSCSFPYGINRYIYQGIVHLNNAGSCCNIIMSWSYCCRSSAITTGAAGANFYTDASMNRCQNPCDNSPVFSNPPVAIVCVGQDVTYNHGVYDFDTTSNGVLSDSLTFEWGHALSAAGTNISYTGQYAYNRPIYFWGFPNDALPFPRGQHLNQESGDIQFRPMQPEVTVMVVRVDEFRNGVKIAELHRDIQMIVISCTSNNPPSITTPNNIRSKSVCAGIPVSFTFTSYDPNSNDTILISWNEAIPGATLTSTNGQTKRPTATLTWTPTANQISSLPYSFIVTARDNGCPINAQYSQAYQIYVKVVPVASYSVTDTGCGKYFFEAHPVKGSGIRYQWTGSGGLSNNSSVFFHQYKSPGTYPFRFSCSSTNGCSGAVYYDTITTKNFLWTQISKDTTICNGNYAYLNVRANNARGNVRYRWSNGDTQSSIIVTPSKSTWYKVDVSDSLNCPTSDSVFIKVNPLPQFHMGNDTAICWKESINIKAYGGIKYNWNTGDTSQKIIKSPLTSTLFKVTVTDNNTCSSSDSIYVTVNPLPKVFAGTDQNICSERGNHYLIGLPDSNNGTAYWTGQSIFKNTTGQWYFNPKAKGINHLGKYPAFYHFTDSNGCSNTDTIVLTVHNLITVDAGFYNKQCIDGNRIMLFGTPPGGTWSGTGVYEPFFDPKSAGLGIHQIIYKQPYTVCPNNDTTYIEVVSLPIVQASSFNGKTEFCPQGLIALNGSPAGGLYGGKWSGDVEPNHNFNSNRNEGIYSVRYSFMDDYGCSNTDTLLLKVTLPEITIDTTQKTICYGYPILLKASYKLADKVLWSKDKLSDGNFQGSTSDDEILFVPRENDFIRGGFWIKIKTISSICISAFDSIYIKTAYNPKTNFSANLVSGYFPLQVKFTDLSTIKNSNIIGYYWDFGDGNKSIIQNPQNTFLNAGSYDVKLITESDFGCKDSITKYDFITTISSLSENTDAVYIRIYPNPAKSYIDVSFTDKRYEIEQLYIYNASGTLIHQQNAIDRISLRIETINLKPGLYLLRVVSDKGAEYLTKFIHE